MRDIDEARSRNALGMKGCDNCKWRSDRFMSVCVNDRSDRLADFVEDNDCCSEWEGKQDDSGRGREKAGIGGGPSSGS